MNKFAITLMVASLTAVCTAQTLGSHLQTVQSGEVRSTYHCASDNESTPSVKLYYQLHLLEAKMSEIRALEVRNQKSTDKTLAKINRAIGSRGIESVSVSCSQTEVRLIFSVLNRETGKAEQVWVSKRKDAPFEVAQ